MPILWAFEHRLRCTCVVLSQRSPRRPRTHQDNCLSRKGLYSARIAPEAPLAEALPLPGRGRHPAQLHRCHRRGFPATFRNSPDLYPHAE
jgi:hypothetical protein